MGKELHRKRVTSAHLNFPVDLPEWSEIEWINEKSDENTVYIYYTVLDTGDDRT